MPPYLNCLKFMWIVYRKTSNISRTLVGNEIVDNSDVVGASPVGAAPTTSSSSTQHLASMDWAKTTARGDKKHLCFGIWCDLQTCQPLRILRNHYAFRVSNTPLRKPVQNVGKLRISRNFGAIRPLPRNLQQLSRLAVSRKSPAGQNIDKDLFILRLPSASASDFATRSTKEASWRGETMPNET